MDARTSNTTLSEGEDGWIIASVPALKGCHSQGKTREEAPKNISEAVSAWLEAEDKQPRVGRRSVIEALSMPGLSDIDFDPLPADIRIRPADFT